MKYAYIESLRCEHTITNMCKWLNVSRPGYYCWRNRLQGPRKDKRALVTRAVIEAFHQFNMRYGAPRIAVELNESDIPCSLNHIAEIMGEQGLRARNGKRFKYQPSPEAMGHVADNLLARDFTAQRPNEKWASDITYSVPGARGRQGGLI